MNADRPPYSPSPSRPPQPTRLPLRWFALAGAVGIGMVLVGALAFTVLLTLLKTTTVTLSIDGEAVQTETRAASVGDLLREQGIVLGAADSLHPALETSLSPDLLIRIDRARSVVLVVDGERQTLHTPVVNPADILARAGVVVGANDRIVLDGTEANAVELAAWSVPATQIVVRHAVPITIDEDGLLRQVQTTAETVGEALFQADVPMYLSDRVSVELNERVIPNMTIAIRRALPVSILADGEHIRLRTHSATVGDALAEAGVTLGGLDYTIPAESMALQPGVEIRIIRVHEDMVIEEERLPFEVVYQADSNLEIDQRRVAQEGREGVRQRRIRVRYENGVEVGRGVDADVVVQPPQNRVISYGTQIVLRTVDTPQGARTYWRRLRVFTTSYHPAALGGDDVTATGRRLQHGIIGADTRLLPFGTELYVPGYGVGVVADTGARRHDPFWIDLGYSDADWRSWSRYVDIYVLTPVPETINYLP